MTKSSTFYRNNWICSVKTLFWSVFICKQSHLYRLVVINNFYVHTVLKLLFLAQYIRLVIIIQGMLLIKTYTDQLLGPTMDLHDLKHYRQKYEKQYQVRFNCLKKQLELFLIISRMYIQSIPCKFFTNMYILFFSLLTMIYVSSSFFSYKICS